MKNMKYSLAESTFDEAEMDAIQSVLGSGQFTMGVKVANAESDFAQYFGSKYSIMVNSGSSANLIAVAVLRLMLEAKGARGREVIVPAVSWSTTFSPLYHLGFKLRFVDVSDDDWNLTVDGIEKAITEETVAIFAVNLLGAPADLSGISALADKYGIYLIEDNCESMGASIDERYAGSFGLMGTFSTFFSHHICTLEGGFVVTDNDDVNKLLRMVRAHGWERDLDDFNDTDFYAPFRFVVPGFNVRPTEISGALASVQLGKLEHFIANRSRNAKKFLEVISKFEWLIPQKVSGVSSWFGFGMVLDGDNGIRDRFALHLRTHGIQNRPIVAGNFLRQPTIKFFEYSVSEDIQVADRLMDNGIFIGNHHYAIDDKLNYFEDVIKQFRLH